MFNSKGSTPIVHGDALPRCIRRSCRLNGTNPFQSLVDASARRSMRFLSSFSILESEIQDSRERINNSASLSKADSEEYAYRDERQPFQKVILKDGLLHFDMSLFFDYFHRENSHYTNWKRKDDIRFRRRWGEYFRSNMDWDWDVKTCFENLFKLEADEPGDSVDDTETLILIMGARPKAKLQKVKLAYPDEMGKIVYETFLACPSVEDAASPTTLEELLYDMASDSQTRAAIVEFQDVDELTGNNVSEPTGSSSKRPGTSYGDFAAQDGWDNFKLNTSKDRYNNNSRRARYEHLFEVLPGVVEQLEVRRRWVVKALEDCERTNQESHRDTSRSRR